MKKILTSLSIIIATTGAFAVGENIVASKAYTDTKQAKIPATGTNAATPGTTVVTYTGTAGQIGERGIYDGSGNYNSGTDANKLATAGMVKGAISAIPTVETSKLVCANSPACTLWTIQEQTVSGSSGGSSGSGNSGNNSCGLYDQGEVWIISGSGQGRYCNDDIASCDGSGVFLRADFLNDNTSVSSQVPANVTEMQIVLGEANDFVSCINSKGHCTAEARCVQ